MQGAIAAFFQTSKVLDRFIGSIDNFTDNDVMFEKSLKLLIQSFGLQEQTKKELIQRDFFD